jgi:hypothetical protein
MQLRASAVDGGAKKSFFDFNDKKTFRSPAAFDAATPGLLKKGWTHVLPIWISPHS